SGSVWFNKNNYPANTPNSRDLQFKRLLCCSQRQSSQYHREVSLTLPPVAKGPESLEVVWAPAEADPEALRKAFKMLSPDRLLSDDYPIRKEEPDQLQLPIPS